MLTKWGCLETKPRHASNTAVTARRLLLHFFRIMRSPITSRDASLYSESRYLQFIKALSSSQQPPLTDRSRVSSFSGLFSVFISYHDAQANIEATRRYRVVTSICTTIIRGMVAPTTASYSLVGAIFPLFHFFTTRRNPISYS